MRILRRSLLVCLVITVLAACASNPHPSLASLQQQMENARISAASLDAARRCPDQWIVAEDMVLRAERFKQNNQNDSARAALHFAVDLYQTAAECAAQARDRELGPSIPPIPPPGPVPHP